MRSSRLRFFLIPFIFIMALFLGSFLSILIEALHLTRLPVDQVVGHAMVLDKPKLNDMLSLMTCLTLMLAGGGLSALLVNNSLSDSQTISPVSSNYAIRGWRLALSLVLVAIAFGYVFPPLPDLAASLKISKHSFHWDSDNIFAWNYLYWKGSLPYRDFWYPYGARIFADTLTISGPLIKGSAVFLVLAGLTMATIQASRSVWIGAASFFLTIRLIEKGLIDSPERYGLPLLIGAAALLGAVSNKKRWYALAGFALSVLFCLEPNLAVAPLFGALLVQLFLAVRGASVRDLLKGSILMALAALPLSAAYILNLMKNGQVAGFRDFYSASHFSLMALYGAGVFDSSVYFFPRKAGEYLPYFSFFATAFSLGFACVRHRLSLPRWTIWACYGLLIVLPVLLKDTTRPPITAQLMMSVWSFLLILASLLASEKRLLSLQNQRPWNSILMIVALATTGFMPWKRVNYGFAQASIFLTKPFQVAQELREGAQVSFSRDGLDLNEAQSALIEHLNSIPELKSAPDAIYVMGDESWIYIAMDKTMPPHLNHYNASPLVAQTQIVDWIRTHKPSFLVWNTQRTTFDGVQHIVRTPLIFEYAVQNFRFREKLGTYYIFQRSEGHAPSTEGWKDVAGTAIELGRIPFFSRLVSSQSTSDCASISNAETCAEVLLLQTENCPERATLKVKHDNEHFAVALTPRGEIGAIQLKRLWFMNILDHAHTQFEIDCGTVEMKQIRIDQNLLY